MHFADRPDLAALLSTEASLLDDSPQVAASLLDSLENDARLYTFLRGHTAPVYALAFSPDGRLLASGGDDRVIRLWDARTWEPVATLKNGHTGTVWSLAFSPDGSLLASGSTDRTVRLWNVAARAPAGPPLGGHTGRVRSLAFDRTGKVLLSSSATEGGENETLSWDLAAVPPAAKPFGGGAGSSGNLALGADGRLLAVGSGGIVSLWNLDTQQRLPQPLATEGVFLQGLAFSPDGKLLAAGDDAGLTVWDLSGARPTRRQLSDNADFTLEVAISPDGKLLAGGGNDRFVRLWNLESNKQDARPLIGHTGFVTALAFHPGGGTFVSGSEDGTLIVWSAEPRSRVRQHLRHPGRVVSAAFIDEQRLATGSFDGSIVLWNLASGKPVASRRITAGAPVEKLAFAGAKNALLACDGRQRLLWWSVRGPASSVALMDGGCSDSLVTETGTSHVELRAVSESPIEQDSDHRVTISDLESRPVRNLTATIKFKWNDTSLALSADRRSLAVGTDNGALYLWNLQSEPPERRELRGHAGRVADLVFSPDGALLASAGHDGTIRLWDVARGELHRPPIQAPGRVDHVRFDRSGRRLAALYPFSLRERPALQLWDVASGVAIGAPLRGAATWSIGHVVAFSPGGRWVVAGGDEDEILLLDADVASWRAHACRFANRNLSPTDEWPQYFPGQPYHKTCPNLPLPIAIPVIRHDQEEELF